MDEASNNVAEYSHRSTAAVQVYTFVHLLDSLFERYSLRIACVSLFPPRSRNISTKYPPLKCYCSCVNCLSAHCIVQRIREKVKLKDGTMIKASIPFTTMSCNIPAAEWNLLFDRDIIEYWWLNQLKVWAVEWGANSIAMAPVRCPFPRHLFSSASHQKRQQTKVLWTVWQHSFWNLSELSHSISFGNLRYKQAYRKIKMIAINTKRGLLLDLQCRRMNQISLFLRFQLRDPSNGRK